MNSRERVIKAFSHEEPDQVPVFVQSIMPKFYEKLEAKYADSVTDEDIIFVGRDYTLIKKLGFDMSWGASCSTTQYDGSILHAHPLPNLGANKSVNHNGRITEHGTLNGHAQSWVAGSILKTVEQADEWYETYIKPPEKEIPNAVQMTNRLLQTMPKGAFVPVAGVGGAIFEPLWEGLGGALYAKLMRKHKDKLKQYAQWMTNHAVRRMKIAVETDFDVFAIADDSAYKNAPMMDPALHRELVIPYYKQVCEVVKKAGKFVFFHSDGFITPYFDGLVEAGFSGVESMEPMAGNDLKFLKDKYGDKLCLIGNVDVSQVLPLGSPTDVMNEVKRCINAAAQGGGFILSPCTDLTDAVPLENAEAMIAAVRKYGQYKK